MQNSLTTFVFFINAAVLAATPLLFGTLGEMLTEKSGNLNLGVEGQMMMGAACGLGAAYLYEQTGPAFSPVVAALLAVLFGFLAGALGGLIYSVVVVTFRANQNVTGLTLTIFGVGLGNFIGEMLGIRAGGYASVSDATKAIFGSAKFFGAAKPPVVDPTAATGAVSEAVPVVTSGGDYSFFDVIGQLFFSYDFMVYFAIVVALVMAWYLNRTRSGLSLRSVGESPATADAAGINVAKYKYLATCIGGGICGLGGMYVSMVRTSGTWVFNCVSGQGWIAVALVIFAAWSPKRALFSALLFGALSVLRYYLPIQNVPTQVYNIIPFLATVLVLIFTSIRQSKENTQPKSTGTNYFREER